MLVKVLQITEYGKSGASCESKEIKDPSWPDIEAAIRRLDKYCYPFIWLFLQYDTEDLPEFQIMGGKPPYSGKADYWMQGNFGGYYGRCYSNPNVEGEDHEVRIWTSDQGYSDYESTICHDVEEVLKATRYFCEHGGFDPSVSWEEQERETE